MGQASARTGEQTPWRRVDRREFEPGSAGAVGSGLRGEESGAQPVASAISGGTRPIQAASSTRQKALLHPGEAPLEHQKGKERKIGESASATHDAVTGSFNREPQLLILLDLSLELRSQFRSLAFPQERLGYFRLGARSAAPPLQQSELLSGRLKLPFTPYDCDTLHVNLIPSSRHRARPSNVGTMP